MLQYVSQAQINKQTKNLQPHTESNLNVASDLSSPNAEVGGVSNDNLTIQHRAWFLFCFVLLWWGWFELRASCLQRRLSNA
jgi:hypothetical protein